MSSVVPNKRMRFSIWVGMIPLDEEMLKGAAGIIDDLTLIYTIANAPKTNVIGYEYGYTADRTAAEVAACHAHGIQCLAGFQLTSETKGERTTTFERFLSTATTSQIEAKAREMVARIDEPTKAGARTALQTFDGLGFDNESLDLERYRASLIALYRAAAAEVTQADGGLGRFVSIGGPPLSSPTKIVLENVQFKGSPAAPASGFMLNHPYGMSLGLRNLVMRPMCYDTFSADPPTPAATRTRWHADILDYAVGTGRTNDPRGPATHRSVFQMGFKNAKGAGNDPKQGGNLDGIVEPGPEMEAVCWRMRQAGVGVILFAFPSHFDSATKTAKPRKQYLAELASYYAQLARYNFVLNGAAHDTGPDWSKFVRANPTENTCRPGAAKQPAQAPIGPDGQQRLGKPSS